MSERQKILTEMVHSIEEELPVLSPVQAQIAAEAALRVIEAKNETTTVVFGICNCSNDGYSSYHEVGCPLAQPERV